ncbi:MAG: hypothetical protein GPJ00_01100 [Microcystis aeruginosa W13-18]|nr:hypothetical protein [Microcystis aeruginosa W13-18]NCR34960.1 hypothetical protein [Microcystis aeruginosa S11-05]NCR48439.1 hypothetical protein [Microcystis aeruginosa S11-01]
MKTYSKVPASEIKSGDLIQIARRLDSRTWRVKEARKYCSDNVAYGVIIESEASSELWGAKESPYFKDTLWIDRVILTMQSIDKFSNDNHLPYIVSCDFSAGRTIRVHPGEK